jgi:hypothetical protein
MNSKILWSEADRVHKLITKPLKDGTLILSKNAKIDVDKVPHAVIEFKDKVVEGALYIFSTFGLVLGTLLTGNMILGLCVMLCGVLLTQRLSKKRTIMFPFFFAKWNCCTPFDITKKLPIKRYTVKEMVSVEKQTKEGKKTVWKKVSEKVREVGSLEFFEMKIQDPPTTGIPMYTPQDLVASEKNTAMREIMKGEHGEKMNIPLLVIIMVLGLMMGLYISPILTQYMTQAAAATPPPTP